MTGPPADGGPLPLDGVLVADFSRVLAGPLATVLLADLGATVVKVERPGTGDDTRRWGPPWTARGSSYFEAANRTKRSIALDLDDPDDRTLAHALADRADVLVENFRPGALARHGLDAPTARARNPRLVYCSVSGFGSAGGAALSGYDFVVQAAGGLMSLTGEADGEPLKVGVALVDVLTGKDAVIGVLAALRRRERTGSGDHVQVDLLSSLLGSLVNQLSGHLATGESPPRMGNRHPSIAPYETLRCADGLLAVAVGNDRQFAALADLLGLDVEERFATNAGRVAARDDLVRVLEGALARGTVGEWEERLAAVGIAASPVNDLPAALARAAALGLDPLVDVGPGGLPQVRHPVRYDATPPAPPVAPPLLDEHGDEVRAWLADPGAGTLPPLGR